MPTPKELGYPLLPRGAGSISWHKGAWEGHYLEDKRRVYAGRNADYFKLFEQMEQRHRRKLSGRYVTPAEMTVRDLMESYIERRIAYNKWSDSTAHQYRQVAKRHIYPALGDVRITAIDPPRLQHWIDQLARQYKPTTISAITSLLSAGLNFAVKQTIIPSNPCRYVEHPEPETVQHTVWTVEEIRRVDEALQDEPRWLAVYRLMLSTGMRPGELRALIWSDIDFAAGRIRIARTISEDAKGHLVVGPDTKSGKTRYVSLAAGPRAALLSWQAALVRRSLDPKQDWVFPGTKGQPMSRNLWVRRHQKLVAETGVPMITFHELRHTSGSLEMAQGTPLKVVSERLGHKDPAFTARVYQHVDTTMQQDAADRLDEKLFGSGG